MYHGLVPWKAYCSLLFPTGHCTACISMSHRPSLFSAKSTLPVIHFIHQREQQQHPIIVKTTSSNTAIIMIIILIPLKGAIRDFFFFFFFFYNLLTAPRIVSNMYIQKAKAKSCANHVQHIRRSSRAMYRVPRGTK